MHLSLSEYLHNPQGKGSVSLGLSNLKFDYNKRYDALIEKHKKLDTVIYKDRNDYLIHIKLPSESYDGVVYDMIIKFVKTGNANVNNILNWDIQVMTNSPSFNFTYANIFRANKLLIDELKFMVDHEAYANRPKVRNPYMLLGPEKNLYFTMLYIKEKYSAIHTLDTIGVKYDSKKLKSEVIDIGKTLALIDIAKAKKQQLRRKEKEQQKHEISVIRKLQTNKQVTSTQNISKANVVKSIKPVSSVSKARKVKKI